MTGDADFEGYSLADWQKHYDEEDLKWDLGEVAPIFARLVETGELAPGKTVVPGCGQGHEVVYFSRQGFQVTGVDFAPGAVERLDRKIRENGLKARVVGKDFFQLGDSHHDYYDLMLEQTFFCAILPAQRTLYVETAARILRQGGRLVGLFYETGEEGGPPFNTTRQDILNHFASRFVIEDLEKNPHSVERRKNKEWLVRMRKK